MGEVGYLIAYAVITLAAVQVSVNSAPTPPKPPKLEDPVIDKTALQEEAERKKLEIGEDDEKRRRRKGKSAFITELAKEREAAETDPGGVQIDKAGAEGVQLGGAATPGAPATKSKPAGGGVQL